MASIGMMKAIVAIFIVRIDRWNGFHIIDLIILKWKRQKRKFLSRVKIYVKCKILIYTFSNIYLYEWENEILLSNTMHNIPHNYRTYGRGGVFFKENPMYLTIKWIQKSNVLTVNTNTFPYFIPKKCTFRVFHQSKYVIIVFLDFSSITHQCMYLLLSALLTFQLVAIVQKKEREKNDAFTLSPEIWQKYIWNCCVQLQKKPSINLFIYTIDAMHGHSKPDFSLWGHIIGRQHEITILIFIDQLCNLMQVYILKRERMKAPQNSSNNAIFILLARLKRSIFRNRIFLLFSPVLP